MYKIPLVSSDFPEEVNMISFRKIAKWNGASIAGFQYDIITDEMIKNELDCCNDVNLDIDWEDDPKHYEIQLIEDTTEFDKRIKQFHSRRIAAIVKLIENGGTVHPVELDTFCADFCCSCISNGHHRIRALQYLGYTHFPATCSGLVTLIQKLVNIKIDKKIKFI